jgi:hypothetical protein
MATDLHLPHQLASANQTLSAACHCKSVQFTVTVSTSALPLPVHLCHCSICRHTHGTLCSFHAPLPKHVEPEFVPPSSLDSSLTGYIHSPQAASERFFCTTCGCHIGDRDLKPDPETGKPEWRVATSIFTTHNEDTFQIRSHCFTSPATEPNLSTWLPSVNGREVHVWNPSPSDPHFPLASSTSPEPSDPNRLLAQCHCTGVTFTIAPPTPSETTDPFLSRYLHPSPSPSQPPPNETKTSPFTKLTTPPTPKRVACLCLCTDCRLTSGAHAIGWTFVPLPCIRPAIRDPAQFEGGFGTLKAYRSSKKVTRAFCGVCGASVFYALDDEERVAVDGQGEGGRVMVVDVAVGLLRGESVAVEEWVTWRTGRLAGMRQGEGFDGGFAEGLVGGLREWGVRRNGEVVLFDIPKSSG